MDLSQRMRGSVESFDGHRGLGQVRAADGRLYDFHCIGIADGSRTIEIGTPVKFGLLAKLGRYEATDIAPQ